MAGAPRNERRAPSFPPSAWGIREGTRPALSGAFFPPPQQHFPFMPRKSGIVEIGARPFAAVIEEADVVVGLLDRLDLARDEKVEFVEIGDQIGRQIEIQGGLSRNYRYCRFALRRCEALQHGSIKLRRRRPSQATGQGLARAPRLRNWMVSEGGHTLISRPIFFAAENQKGSKHGPEILGSDAQG